jgi:hypothetical protein
MTFQKQAEEIRDSPRYSISEATNLRPKLDSSFSFLTYRFYRFFKSFSQKMAQIMGKHRTAAPVLFDKIESIQLFICVHLYNK